MKVLILEDDIHRIETFRKNLIGCELYVTKDPKEAIEWLKEFAFTYIFLDHDLEEWQYGESSIKEGTGYDVALFIAESGMVYPDTKIFIHSLNPAGSARMARALGRRATVVPFFNLFK